jgi:ABC-type multidrug transport system fused ATPase/permease subunit
MNITQDRQVFSSGILRLVGYGLLVMALVDILFLLIPPQLMNPVWEFQTMGAIIERIPVTLLGIVLVYYGERSDRAPIETLLLRWLSWFCLIFAIFLLITFPLNIINGFRIYYNNNAQVNQQIGSQIESLNNFQTELKSAKSLEQINQILQQQSNSKINIPESVDGKQLKADILKSVVENQNNLKSQAANLQTTKRFDLLKQGIKWNLGSLISACILLYVWQHTFWSRIKYEPEID